MDTLAKQILNDEVALTDDVMYNSYCLEIYSLTNDEIK